MDNVETASNCSHHSDSLQSNASSISGLSSYGNEFAELRHLVNPSKYPQPYLERCSTPRAELIEFDNDKLAELKTNLGQSLELNEQYKFQLQNLEKKIELKYCDKIDRLLRSNSRLEVELENANNQIERLIQSYNKKSVSLILHEKLDLERKVYQLRSDYSELQRQSAKTLQGKYEVDLENKRLKINLGDLLTERDIKNCSIQSLKQKVSSQHVELQNTLKSNSHLCDSLNLVSAKLTESEKSKVWYKEQLSQCKNDKVKLNEELMKCKNYITSLNVKIFNLNIDLNKYQNEIDEVRLQALKEKEELFKKLDNINLDCNVPANLNNTKNALKESYKHDIHYYEHTVEDLRAEVSRIKSSVIDKDKEFEKLNHENSDAISKCLILQKTLAQKEADIEILESSKNEVLSKLEYLKKNEKAKLHEILQLQSKITELEIGVKLGNQEKQDVDESVQFIRAQFLKFKENYEKVKRELDLKNKDILQLQKDKQELFMNNNWTLCKLDKIKHKDIIIEGLKKENENLVINIENLTKQRRLAEFQKLKSEKILEEKENANLDFSNELVHHNSIVTQFKTLSTDQEAKIILLQDDVNTASDRLIELENMLDSTKVDIEGKDLKLSQTLKVIELQQSSLTQLSSEKENILESLNILQKKYKHETENKDKHIRDLNCKLQKLELERQSYLKRVTDDQKVELLLNKQKFSSGSSPDRKLLETPIFTINHIENQIKRFFDNLNIEEFESTVDIRLKYLDERIQKIRGRSGKLEEKLNNECELNKIKELEILLQVKDRDMQEKQKKMDRNNRTLLRKVKEHMRGRNAAEKQLKYLQDLYNTLADNCNTSKLSISSKDYQIETLQEFCSNYKKEIEKLRNVIIKLEQKQFANRICQKCVEVENVKENLLYFKTFCEELQQRNRHLEEEIHDNEENVVIMQKKIREQEFLNQSQQEEFANTLKKCEEKKASLFKLEDLESTNVSQATLIRELENKLLEKDDLYRISVDITKTLKQDLIEATQKIEFLSNEIQMSSSNFQQKIEYFQELEEKIRKLEEQSFQVNTDHQIIITEYKKRMYSMQNDINVLKNDKFFLQRLSNDLKVALNSYIDHNKKLQEQLKLLSTEQQPFRSLPANFLDSISLSGKYDDKYISQLLAENRAFSASGPVTEEFEGCLSKLREEIFSLQNQISKKNNTAYLDVG